MNYVGFLIANFATGFDVERQPWLLPNDAQFELLDGYVYRGVWQKRQGYSQFATGQVGGSSYTESRMIHEVAAAFFAVGTGVPGPYTGFARNVYLAPLTVGDGTVGPYDVSLSGTNITPGSIILQDPTTPQTLLDNGVGGLVGDGTGSIDYVNGVVSFAFTTAVGVGDPITQSYNNQPVARGSITITQAATAQTVEDDGMGGFTGDGTGTINYRTGAISITFDNNANATAILITADYHQGLPVMGIMNFYNQNQSNIRELIVTDTRYVNRYNPNTNRLEDISPAYQFTGDETNFFSWTNYPDPAGNARLLFVNNIDQINQYSGTDVTIYPVYTATTVVPSGASGVVGDGTVGPYVINTPAGTGILPGTLTINEPISAQTVTDNLFGGLQGDGTGTVDYQTGTITVTFNNNVLAANPINIAYTQLNTPLDSCLHIKQFKDRLVLLSTIEVGGVIRGLRIRISGTGAQGDVFTTDAIGAGFIDLPDQTFIQACDFNRDDLIIFTQSSTWVMKYTGNDVVPFALDKIDESRGSQAPYGTITYLNRTSAESPRGLILTDGYSVERSDGKIPDFSFNSINQDRFGLCFAGAVDEDRDHYLIYPTPNTDPTWVSDRILVTNYEEDNLAIYRIPLSCMGNFIGGSNVTWNDLLIYKNWDELAAVYGNWNSFAYSKGAPFAVGGGHEGQIFKLNVEELEDYPVQVRGATVIDGQTLQVTTDFQNYAAGDIITLEALGGMLEANDKQGAISEVVTPNYVFNLVINTAGFSAYTEGGVASKVVQFTTKTKKFNPFADQNQKVRCGWVYFYVSHTSTNLTDNQVIIGATNTNPCVLQVPGHGYTTGLQVYVNAVQGMTELNGNYYYVTVIDQNTISLDGVDATGYGVYTTGGFTSTPTDAKLQVRVIVNDTEQSTQVNSFNPAPYEVNLTNAQAPNGIKKWYKLFVNQVGRFIQLELSNAQAGAKIEIQAIMPGFAGIGRLI